MVVDGKEHNHALFQKIILMYVNGRQIAITANQIETTIYVFVYLHACTNKHMNPLIHSYHVYAYCVSMHEHHGGSANFIRFLRLICLVNNSNTYVYNTHTNKQAHTYTLRLFGTCLLRMLYMCAYNVVYVYNLPTWNDLFSISLKFNISI